MSLSDESFPDDALHITTIDRRSNISSCNSSSPSGNYQNISSSTSGQSSSGASRETTQSDPVKNSEGGEEEDYTQKVRSCQDLHSIYTKRKYPHVKSKVREFIERQKVEEEHRKSTTEYFRQLSIQENMDGRNIDVESVNDVNDGKQMANSIGDPPSDIALSLAEKEQEMLCLKAFNEYLQSSLQEKMIEATRLRRNVDSMRIELMNAKDKAKRHSMHSIGMEFRNNYSPRLSLPTLVYKLPRNSTGTQTDFIENLQPTTDSNNNSIGLYENKNVATVQPLSMNFSNDHIQRQIRRRNNSTPSTPTGDQTTNSKVGSDHSDSAIDTEEGDSSSENVLKEQFIIFEKEPNDTTNPRLGNDKKKKRSFKRKLNWIFGPCGKCSDQKNNSIGEQYSQTPLLDSMCEQRLRVAENNYSS